MDISSLSDWLVMIAGIFVAIKTIFTPIIKSTNWFKNKFEEKRDERIEEKVEEVIDDIVPNEIINMLTEIQKQLKSVIYDNKCQETRMRSVEETLVKLRKGNQDTMRVEMNKIYFKYLPYQAIADFDKQAFMHIYEDYKQIGGNTYIDDMKKTVETWKVVPTQNDIPGFLNERR